MDNINNTKYCQHCGAQIPLDAVVCTACGRQVQSFNQPQQPVNQQSQPYQAPPIIINNTNTNTNTNMNGYGGRARDKWVAFFLCLFLGMFGAHKFYEGKTGMGLLYLFTFGLCGIGWIVDLVILFLKPNPYFI